jgi:hypothetical protein
MPRDIATLVDGERLVLPEGLGPAPWDHRALVHVVVGHGGEPWGEPDGLRACAPSRFPQRGTHAVGVQRQWGGHRGPGAHGQGGVCLGYISRHAHGLLDFRLSLPADWTRAEQRRQECPVPVAVHDQTRQAQGLERHDEGGGSGFLQ